MAASKIFKLALLKNSVRFSSFRSCHHVAGYTQAVLNLPDVKVSELSNGLKIATESTSSPVCTVGLWADAGSRYETAETNGAANFFEHLIFKGSNKRSQKDLENEVMSMGAQLHAFTDREETAFFAKCLVHDVPNAVDIIGDAIQNTKFEQSEIEKQRKVILRELEDSDNDLTKTTFDYLHLTAYQGTPLQKSVYGPTENINKMSRSDIELYAKNMFIGPRMVLVTTGSVSHDEMVKLAEKHLSSIPLAPASSVTMDVFCRFTGSEVRDRNDYLPYAHVAIAVDTCGLDSPDVYPLMLGKVHINSWDKTLGCSDNTIHQLIEDVHRGKEIHSFDSFHILYKDTGLWGCYYVIDKYGINHFRELLQDQWMRLCINATELDLMVAKSNLRSELLANIHHEDPTRSWANIGKQVFHFGRRIPLSEIEDKIEAVTLKRFRDTCAKYIYDRCPAVAAVGPVEGLYDYTRIRSNMYWLRY